MLGRWLCVRPQSGVSWAVLSWTTHDKLRRKAVNQVWKGTFHPQYAESTEHRVVRSQAPSVHDRLDRRTGPEPGAGEVPARGYARERDIEKRRTVKEYIHSSYADIEAKYRSRCPVTTEP